MEDHPASKIFPLMNSLDLANLVKDIRENGQRQPIIVHEGKVLDGRNRLRACVMNSIKPWVQEWDGEGDPVDYVISLNLHRRQLDASQRAVVAHKVREIYEERAKANRRSGGVAVNFPQGRSRDLAGASLGVSGKSVDMAGHVAEMGEPGLLAAVESGSVAVSAAAEVARLPRDQQRQALAGGPRAVKEAAKAARQSRAPKSDPSVLRELKALWKRADAEERAAFLEWVHQ